MDVGVNRFKKEPTGTAGKYCGKRRTLFLRRIFAYPGHTVPCDLAQQLALRRGRSAVGTFSRPQPGSAAVPVLDVPGFSFTRALGRACEPVRAGGIRPDRAGRPGYPAR